MPTSLRLPARVPAGRFEIVLRRAGRGDLEAIVRLLSDHPVSAARGDVADPDDLGRYAEALDEILDDPRTELVVTVDPGGRVVGTPQLTSIPGRSRRGSTSLLVEAVRVAADARSSASAAP